MRKAGKRSIRREIFNSSLILSAIILIVFSLFLSKILYDSGISKAYEIIKQRNYAINFFIEGYFAEIENTIKILATNKEVQDAPWLDSAAQQKVRDLYKSFSNVNKNITYIYSGYKNKQLLINDYIPPEGFDPTIRPWYQSAMGKKPVVSIGLPYQEAKTREWLFSISQALLSEKYGYTGVVSSDTSIHLLGDLLKKRGDVYKSSYSFVAKPDGEIILHHNESFLKKLLSEIIDMPVSLEKKEGHFFYKLQNTKKIAFYSRCHEPDWIVVTVVDKQEIINPIIRQISFCIILSSLIAVLLGLAQSSMLSRRFSNPLFELRKRVNAIINGNWNNDPGYIYPDNEIGIIAKEVGQLAEHELEMHAMMMRNVNSIIIRWDQAGNFTFVNRYTLNFFGYSEQELLGKNLVGTIVPKTDSSGQNLDKMIKDILKTPELFINNENENFKKNGERVWISWTNKPIYDKNGKMIEMLTVGNDITRRKQAEDKLEVLASIDMLTKGMNRRVGIQFLEKSLHLAKRQGQKLTIGFLDINNLKIVNDTLGHKKGDELIRTSFELIKKCLRASDAICRLGGDEFLLILPNCNITCSAKLWERIKEKIKAKNSQKNQSFQISISQGFVEYDPEDELPDINKFIAVADKLMYAEKKRQKANWA